MCLHRKADSVCNSIKFFPVASEHEKKDPCCDFHFDLVNIMCLVCGHIGTKTLVVHGQNECDIPTQLPVHEDTQFEALLKVTITVLGYLQIVHY